MRLRFGEYGKQYYEGMLNTPITDSVALRINGVYNKSDGWMKDAATGEDLLPERTGPGARRSAGSCRTTTTATLAWDHDDLDQMARPAIGLVPVQSGQTQVPYPADPATYLDPRKAKVYNDVVGNEESRQARPVHPVPRPLVRRADFRSSTSVRQFETVNREDEDGTNLIAT